MKSQKLLILVLFLSFLPIMVEGQVSPPLIPAPQKMSCDKTRQLSGTFIIKSTSFFRTEQKLLAGMLKKKGLTEADNKPTADFVVRLQEQKVENPRGYVGAYKLSVSDGIDVKSSSTAGIFYAIQTLRQLLSRKDGLVQLPQCEIKDWPAFQWRGYMVDVGRNYQSVGQLKDQIRVMAYYKMNKFHLHLTDNPGWRLESNIYPELQSKDVTSREPGKYYTQQAFKELVKFGAERHVTVVPEFDIPGHTRAFRKAFGLSTMNTDEAQKKIINLIDELSGLASAQAMPYVHLGTDEAQTEAEKVKPEFLVPIFKAVHKHNRRVVHWRPGITVPADHNSIDQLWKGDSHPRKGHPFIDSRADYLNHMDPLAAIYRLFFQQPTRAASGNDIRLGGEICLWHDNRVNDERNLLRQNPVYAAIVTYSEAVWTGKKRSYGRKYWSKLPPDSTEAYKKFEEFETRLIAHRNRYFKNKPFPYVKNGKIPWRIIGPFDHKGDMSRSFPVEKSIKTQYRVDGNIYHWRDEILHGGTIHLKHFFGFPSPIKQDPGTVYALTYIHSPKRQKIGAWIGFNNWSRSGGRRGGPTPPQGEWDITKPKVWVNDHTIAPPHWENPHLPVSSEVPFTNEDYYYRPPTQIKLQKGWNKVLLKIPQGGNSWKWMFTFVPVKIVEGNVREVKGLKFAVSK